MAFEASVDRDRDILAGMTILAAGCVGFVQDITDQGRSIAPMGTVAGTAFAQVRRKVGMFLPHRSHRMALQAERFRILDQQGLVRGLMRQMAGVALPLGIGLMGIFIVPGQFGVAGEAGFRGAFVEQPGEIR